MGGAWAGGVNIRFASYALGITFGWVGVGKGFYVFVLAVLIRYAYRRRQGREHWFRWRLPSLALYVVIDKPRHGTTLFWCGAQLSGSGVLAMVVGFQRQKTARDGVWGEKSGVAK